MIIKVSWNKYDLLTKKIACDLKSKQFDQIVGISRSGLILGVHISHLLNIRKLGCTEVLRTKNDSKNSPKSIPKITYWVNIDNSKGKKILLVDDIVGEGETMRLVRKECEKYGAKVTTCVLMVNLNNFKKNDLNDLVNFHGELVKGWVIFPWCLDK